MDAAAQFGYVREVVGPEIVDHSQREGASRGFDCFRIRRRDDFAILLFGQH